ncbi:PP-loop domain protein [Methanohalobium evestigatum Z-7303]|uniref:PP-loop domain protein n=1 Tax=Methanohalobium evestigatum (strain ATCC BAA-1072 / DSM 3721 / NBRC 107634 / OCM 161 / Z-7303) TaxID=644295 RepID=D7E6W1_METEZ|nr:PP-loop domain protein [Methanohalobium evestigatum Z-7303]
MKSLSGRMTSMGRQCTKCDNESIIYQKYSGMHLCKKHFVEDVERKIKLTIRKHYNINRNETIAIALSGGKDSTVLLYILNKIFGDRPDINLVAITIDEGISGYRLDTIQKSKELTDNLGIKHVIRSFADEYGMTLDELTQKQRSYGACSYCGVFRKKLLNKTAKEEGATRLAIGHNLDDEAQTILLNHLKGDISRLVRLDPPKKIEGLTLRIKPLRSIPEKEVALYAIVNELPMDFSECPYAHEAIRGEVRDMLNEFESKHPGTKHSLLSGFQKLLPILAKEYPPEENKLNECSVCGDLCTGSLCQACKLLGYE